MSGLVAFAITLLVALFLMVWGMSIGFWLVSLLAKSIWKGPK